MTKFFSVSILLLTVFYGFHASAEPTPAGKVCGLDTYVPPSCEEMGYKKPSEINCLEGVIHCPMDPSYIWCKEYTCEDGRLFTTVPANGYNCEDDKVAYHGLSCFKCTPKKAEDYGYQEEECDVGYIQTAYSVAIGDSMKTCYSCKPQYSYDCAVGDVFYDDGTCSSIEIYNPASAKKAVGVVYMLTDAKNGIPVFNEETGSMLDITSPHGHVINLHDLTVDDNYNFNAANPYNNTSKYMPWGAYGVEAGTQLVLAATNGIKNHDSEPWDGLTRTRKIAVGTPTYSGCSGAYSVGSSNYNRYCNATAANATLAFYPPETKSYNSLVGAGNWYIPTYHELKTLMGFKINPETKGVSYGLSTTLEKVNDTLQKLKSKGHPSAQPLIVGIDAEPKYNAIYCYHTSNEVSLADADEPFSDRYSINLGFPTYFMTNYRSTAGLLRASLMF